MKPQLKQQPHLANAEMYATRSLYERYGSMLFGYIYEAVKDKALAEQYLVAIFNELPAHAGEIDSWLKLFHFAKKRLAGFTAAVNNCENGVNTDTIAVTNNRYINKMNSEQQLVFCAVHYHHKTVAQLAAELNTTPQTVRSILKQAFDIIRKEREY